MAAAAQLVTLVTTVISALFPNASLPGEVGSLVDLGNAPDGNTTLDFNEWWGPEDLQGQVDTSVRPAEIKFDQNMIDDLRSRLLNHKAFKAPLKDANFTYGFNSNEIEFWIDYWANKYDFQAREQFVNQFPQYKVNVQGLDIHFIWVKPENPQNKPVVPLLLLHGWPGSIREFYESIPLLTKDDDSRDFAVEVIVPCLTGFGFTDAAVKPGLGAAQMAIVFKNFMRALGHEQFYLQGGDVGSIVGNVLVTIFPDSVLGYHTNWGRALNLKAVSLQAEGALLPSKIVAPELADRMYPVSDHLAFLLEETGYLHEAATKPDSVGIALTDSPAGLLAYLVEKFSGATNPNNKFLPDGGLHDTFTPEQILDNLMFYWVSSSITSTLRFYGDTFTKKQLTLGFATKPTTVPTWVIQSKYELTYQPAEILKLKFTNLLNANAVDFGGHFFALEAPEVFSQDVLTAIAKFIEYHNTPQTEKPSIFDKVKSLFS